MKHIVDNVNKLELTFKTIDLEGRVPATDSIEFLSVEEPYREGRRYSPFVRVRYALNGIKQDKAFPLDVDKGIFLSIDDNVLEERLRPIAPKIVKILQEHAMQQSVERRDSIKMTLKEHIKDISNLLKQGAFANEKERTVSDRIVNRLLQALEWPIFTPQIVIDEYPVEERRVDFALCHPESTPRVFVEVKRVGNIDKGIKQLFEYAFHRGIPIVVLTDGQKWRFYHPAGEGSYEDRIVAEIDLIAENSEECSNCLDRYLNYESVKTGKAAKVIASDYQRIVSQRKTEERLPEVWTELVQEENEDLLRVMVNKAIEKVGHKPTEEQVVSFLKKLPVPSVKPASVHKIDPEQPKQDKKKVVFRKLIVTMPDGEIIDHQHGKYTFAEVVEKLGLEKVMNVRPLTVATEPFYTHRENSKRLNIKNGEFYINVRPNNKSKKHILEKIADSLGVQLKVELVEK